MPAGYHRRVVGVVAYPLPIVWQLLCHQVGARASRVCGVSHDFAQVVFDFVVVEAKGTSAMVVCVCVFI